jgi:hypothetical protein
MQVRTVHMAILFGTVYVCRIIWMHILPAHAVVLVILSGILYIAKLRQSKDPLDVALESLMKEDQALMHAKRGDRTDDNTTGEINITRQTHFVVSESERGIFLYVVLNAIPFMTGSIDLVGLDTESILPRLVERENNDRNSKRQKNEGRSWKKCVVQCP